MLGGHFLHPLDNLIKDDRLFMLEAVLPFVDDSMKAPLAMYIKVMELQLIMRAFGDSDYVCSCGLRKDINNQDDILSSLSGCGFTGLKGQFESVRRAMDMMNAMDSQDKSRPSGMFSDLFSREDRAGGGERGCKPDENDPYVIYGQKAENKAHRQSTSDIYGSIKELFESYDRNEL